VGGRVQVGPDSDRGAVCWTLRRGVRAGSGAAIVEFGGLCRQRDAVERAVESGISEEVRDGGYSGNSMRQ